MSLDPVFDLWPHWGYLCHTAMLMANMGWDDAEDAAQEALIGAWRSRSPWRSECALKGWLWGILRHKVQDRRRRRACELAKLEEAATCGAIIATLVELDPDRRVVDGLPTPAGHDRDRPVEEELDLRSADGAVWVVMGRLPAHYQRVLVAKYLYGWAVDEIAQGMGLSYKAAESLLTRARVAFREVYREVEHGTEAVSSVADDPGRRIGVLLDHRDDSGPRIVAP